MNPIFCVHIECKFSSEIYVFDLLPSIICILVTTAIVKAIIFYDF